MRESLKKQIEHIHNEEDLKEILNRLIDSLDDPEVKLIQGISNDIYFKRTFGHIHNENDNRSDKSEMVVREKRSWIKGSNYFN
ncbi:hypothetical protein [Metabacillus fastidiosus]|uniref:hypothetical protein n=1 Tax=Metabacillus fastidiosus TaxID=1458 RepID=UPI003D2B4B7D